MNEFTVSYGGHVLSFYPIAAGVLAVPFYVLPILFKVPFTVLLIHQLAKLSASVITAASAAIFYAALKRRCDLRWAAILSFVYAFGTWSFSVSSQGLWQHGPAALGLAIGFWGLAAEDVGLQADLACGFGFALAFAARPDAVFIGAAAGLFFLFCRRRRVVGSVLGALGPILLLLAYWLYYTGRLAPPDIDRQAKHVVHFQPDVFLGMMLSPTRGLLFFCPAALFGVWAALRKGRRTESLFLLAGVLGTWIFLSHYNNWMAGMSFGPRYWAGAVIGLVFLCADLGSEFLSGVCGPFFSGCAAFSIIIHALGAYLTWPGSYRLDYEREHLWDWTLHPWLNLARPDGGLGSWPIGARLAAVAAVFALVVVLARAIRRGSELDI
jgi:hypothetical protein